MNHIYKVFHVSLLHKYITYVLRIEDVKLEDNLVYEKHLMQILDRQVKELKNK